MPPMFSKQDKYAIMICGHGSRSKAACAELAAFVEKFRQFMAPIPVEYGYLEFATPVIHQGLEKLRQQGYHNIIAVPGMLFAAGHAKNDIPSVLNQYMHDHPEMNIRYGRELSIDPKMLQAAANHIRTSIGDLSREELQQTMLVVVGRGASDPDANGNVCKLTRLLWEGMGFGWAETVYSGVTFPLVGAGLDMAARLGYKRIVVFPYFWFSGILIKRIYQAVDQAAAQHTEISFHKAAYLGDHPQVMATLADRVTEVFGKENAMNCQMCKYRIQILGFEDQVGLAQESHHHHVEGRQFIDPEDCYCKGNCDQSCMSGGHGHGHGHDHEHGHHHHPYPQADHPLGPLSMKKGMTNA